MLRQGGQVAGLALIRKIVVPTAQTLSHHAPRNEEEPQPCWARLLDLPMRLPETGRAVNANLRFQINRPA
jgi:hypothetical protein